MAAIPLLEVPPGWTVAKAIQVVDISTVPPSIQVEVETLDFYTLSAFGADDVVGTVPGAAQELQQAAQQYGSNVYGLALLHTTEFNALGVSVDRWRWVVVHSQFQALAILIALPFIAAMIAAFAGCQQQGETLQQCVQSITTTAGDAFHNMCEIFGAGCAFQSLGEVLLLFTIAGAVFSFAIYFFEKGLVGGPEIKPPRVPPIRQVQPPRVRVAGPRYPTVSVGTGGGRGRRG
jgi:hypothetical protein